MGICGETVQPCELCGIEVAQHKHHLFSQTKMARFLYGGLFDHSLNIMHLCEKCHLNKPIPKMREKEFCEKLGIKTRSKTGKL